jgi:hypothetical protein
VVRIVFTVFFEDPFWVGVWERECDARYSAAKATFGAQPSEAEVLAFVLTRYGELAFSEPEAGEFRPYAEKNPKRLQREAARAVSASGVGTKAQQALKSQYEANKQEHKALSREQRLMQEERKFQLKQEKRKAKHRGH